MKSGVHQIEDKLNGVSIRYDYEIISEARALTKGIITIRDPNLVLMHAREIRGITGTRTPKAVEMNNLICISEETVEILTAQYVYKHFLSFMKPTKIIDDTGKICNV